MSRYRHRLILIAFTTAIDRLQLGPISRAGLVAHTGLHDNTIGKVIKTWHKRKRQLIYIDSFGPDKLGRLVVPKYMWGPGPDALRPGPKRARAPQKTALTGAQRGTIMST